MNAADAIFINGKFGESGGLAVSRGRVISVGSESAVLKLKGTKSNVIDLQGGWVWPGFIESHAHILHTGFSANYLNLTGAKNFQEVVDLCVKKETQAGSWVVGRGWDQTLWTPSKFPELSDFKNRIQKPVYLVRVDGHAAFVNDIALNLAGITENTTDPLGGQIVRDERGKPTGLLIDNAMELVAPHLPKPSKQDMKKAILRAQEIFHREGITLCCDAGVSLEELAAFQELSDEGQLSLRTYSMLHIRSLKHAHEILKDVSPRRYSEYLNVRALKLFADGALGSRGAAFLKPYCDDPKNLGLLLFEQDELVEICKLAKKNGYQVCVHAIGDRANRIVLDAFAESLNKDKSQRWRVEHAQHVDPVDLPRFAELGVVASQQPLHCTSDRRFAMERLGLIRCQQGAYSWRSLVESGACVCFGSDSPIEPPSVLKGLYAATTRSEIGEASPEGWMSHECLTCQQALDAFTKNGAYGCFEEDNLGKLEIGKLADFVVTSENLLDPLRLREAKVKMTVVGGQVVYNS